MKTISYASALVSGCASRAWSFGSLFAGIGGFDLGLERAGMRSAWNVEREPTCRKLLAAKFPHAAQYDDVQTAGAHNLTPVDLICGGFPCQDLSMAGKRAGLAGARSGLFFELTRITHELKPAFLLWENVPGLLSSDDGRDFARVLMELDRIGYHGAWRSIDAQYFGLAQRRRRVFGLFARGDIGAARCAEILSLAEGVRWHPAPCRESGERVAGTLMGGASGGSSHGKNSGTDRAGFLVPDVSWCLQERDSKGSDSNTKPGHLIVCAFTSKDSGGDAGELSPTLRAMGHRYSHMNGGGQVAVAFQTRIARNGRGQPKEIMDALTSADGGTHVAYAGGVRRLTPRECERLQGFPDDWTAGFADSVRYRMLGNAVAVPCARWIGARIIGHNA